jgi:hypothetical protein
MIEIIKYILLILILLFILFILFYWKTSIYKNEKFKTFFSSLSAIAVIFTVLAITIQSFSYIETLNANNTTAYNNLSSDFFVEVFNMFLSNPDMKYFYEDLLDIKNIDENTKNRNVIKEQQMTMLIFHRSIPVMFYIINNNFDNYRTNSLVSRFNHVMYTFFKSKIFRQYWYVYEEKLAGDPPRIYFKKEFNIKSTHWNDPSLEPEYNPTYKYT